MPPLQKTTHQMQPVQDLLPHLSARITVTGRRGIFTIYYLSYCPEVLYVLPPPTRGGFLAVHMHCGTSQKDEGWWSNPGDSMVKWVGSLRWSVLHSSGYPGGHQEAKSFLRKWLFSREVLLAHLPHFTDCLITLNEPSLSYLIWSWCSLCAFMIHHVAKQRV